ncbi:MAG: nucleotidyltransferase family protein [Armatimonadetes bacterium]|nr:nucleotidyltransferase family protein [Armatimonadota bacterium]
MNSSDPLTPRPPLPRKERGGERTNPRPWEGEGGEPQRAGRGRLDVVIPAGGTIDAAYARSLGTGHRALAPLGPGRAPVMQRVVDALRGSGCVRRVIGVAPPAVQEAVGGVDEWLPSGGSGPDNIRAGLALADPNAPALVCTSDLPLLTAASVREFVERAHPRADVSLGVVSAAAYERAYPDSPMSVFVPFADAGPVTMSCLFQVRPVLLAHNARLLDRAFAGRKSQLQMASLLGPRLLGQFALRRLSLRAVQARAETLLGCRADVLIDVPPDLAFDMDTADDYAYADTRLQTPVEETVAP